MDWFVNLPNFLKDFSIDWQVCFIAKLAYFVFAITNFFLIEDFVN